MSALPSVILGHKQCLRASLATVRIISVAFDCVSSNPSSQKLQPPYRRAAVWAKKCVKSGEKAYGHGTGGGPAEQKCERSIAIHPVNPHIAFFVAEQEKRFNSS